jgi:signal transduction histidine kinase
MKFYARQFSSATGIRVTVRAKTSLTGCLTHQVALYRVLQGALSNVMKHSKAQNVNVLVRTSKGSIDDGDEDDGVGFDSRDPGAALFRAEFNAGAGGGTGRHFSH